MLNNYVLQKYSQALKQNKGKYNTHMQLSSSAQLELQWWINSVETSSNLIYRAEPHIILSTDASKVGWGCVIDSIKTRGLWT